MSYKEELSKKKLQLLKQLDAVNLLLNSDNSDMESHKPIMVEKPQQADLDLTYELKNASQHQQFLIILRETGRFMKIREIAKMLADIIGGDENNLRVKLSRITGKLKKMNKIKSYKIGTSNKNVFWGSPKWIDDEGNIKNEYNYNEDAIEKSASSSLPDL